MHDRALVSGSLIHDTRKKPRPAGINSERDEVLDAVIVRAVKTIEAVFAGEDRPIVQAKPKKTQDD